MHQFDDTAVAVRTHGSQIRLLADILGLEQPKCPSCRETLSTCHETLSKIALFPAPLIASLDTAFHHGAYILWHRRSCRCPGTCTGLAGPLCRFREPGQGDPIY